MAYRLGKTYPGMNGACCDDCAKSGGSCKGMGLYLAGQGHQHFGPGTSMTQFTRPVVNYGMGLFESGVDFTGWGIPEWFIVVIGGYMVMSTFFTTQRVYGKVKALPGERRKAKAARLRKRASELTKK